MIQSLFNIRRRFHLYAEYTNALAHTPIHLYAYVAAGALSGGARAPCATNILNECAEMPFEIHAISIIVVVVVVHLLQKRGNKYGRTPKTEEHAALSQAYNLHATWNASCVCLCVNLPFLVCVHIACIHDAVFSKHIYVLSVPRGPLGIGVRVRACVHL